MFSKNKAKPDGLTTECKPCKKAHRKPEPYNSESACKRQKKYYQKHKENILEKAKEYGVLHKEDKREYNRKYLQENFAKIVERQKMLARANPEKYKAMLKKSREKLKNSPVRYAKALKSKIASERRRRAKKRNCEARLTASEYDSCLEFFNYKDAYTGLEMQTITQDHVVPLAKQGKHIKQNIVPCDLPINASKGKKDLLEWYPLQPFFSEERLAKINQWMNNP